MRISDIIVEFFGSDVERAAHVLGTKGGAETLRKLISLDAIAVEGRVYLRVDWRALDRKRSCMKYVVFQGDLYSTATTTIGIRGSSAILSKDFPAETSLDRDSCFKLSHNSAKRLAETLQTAPESILRGM